LIISLSLESGFALHNLRSGSRRPEKAAQAKPAAAAAPAGAQDGVKLQFSTKEAEAAQQQDVQKQLVTGVFTVHFKQESENGNY
jgi:hypothetical protein